MTPTHPTRDDPARTAMASPLLAARRSLVALVAANLLGWGWAWLAFAGHPLLLGTALLAWVFGLRHAVDADHIAAIDNVTRALLRDPRAPTGAALHVGLWFSLGHSTVVILATAVVAGLAGSLEARFGMAKDILGPIGGAVSALFLLLIAAVNLCILRTTWRSFRHIQTGNAIAPADPDSLQAGGSPLARLLSPVLRAVRRGRHMYLVGLLFGLGFDTATEIGLLGIAANQAANGLSAWQLLVFPALFTAGMALVDTADNVMMVRAYGWAFVHPLRKLWYNLTVTAASVLVALLIGGIEALGLLADVFQFDGWLWRAVTALNRDLAGFGLLVVGIFASCWAVSAAIYRWKGFGTVAENT